MALLKEIYNGAIYVEVLELTVHDTLVCGIPTSPTQVRGWPNRGIENKNIYSN